MKVKNWLFPLVILTTLLLASCSSDDTDIFIKRVDHIESDTAVTVYLGAYKLLYSYVKSDKSLRGTFDFTYKSQDESIVETLPGEYVGLGKYCVLFPVKEGETTIVTSLKERPELTFRTKVKVIKR